MCHQLFASLGYRNNNKLIKMARSIIKILCLGLFSRAFLYTLLLVFLLPARICFWLYFSCWLCQCCLLLCLYFFFKQLHMKENLGNWVGMSKTQSRYNFSFRNYCVSLIFKHHQFYRNEEMLCSTLLKSKNIKQKISKWPPFSTEKVTN